MAGPGKGTWVKVKGAGGKLTTKLIGASFGGLNYTKGQVISKTEYQKALKSKDKQAPRLQKAALSKAEKTQILLKNKKRLKAEAMKSSDGYDRVKRINRLESADRKRRKAQNPDAPAFKRGQKASRTKQLKALGIA